MKLLSAKPAHVPLQTAVLALFVTASALADIPAQSTLTSPLSHDPEIQKISHDILAAALEDAVLDNIRLTHELQALRARDSALGISLLSSNHSDAQERAIDLLRQTVDLKNENQKLLDTIELLSRHIHNSGTADIEIIEAIQNISTSTYQKTPTNRTTLSSSPMQIEIIAQDNNNGWFIANAGWDAGLIEGMLYKFQNPDGSSGDLRVIQTRRNVCALIPQMGGAIPQIGQKLTLQTR
jgi:hypothetical protein